MYVPLDESRADESMGAPNVPIWKSLLLVFFPSLVVFVLLDVTWISLVACSMYKSVLGDALRLRPRIAPGLLAWLCIVGAVYCFALPNTRTATAALRQGLLLGVLLYGTYEFTNLSILEPWTWGLALADAAWGATACGVAAVLQLWLLHKLTAA